MTFCRCGGLYRHKWEMFEEFLLKFYIYCTKWGVTIKEGKVKVHHRRGHEGPEGEWRYSFTLLLTLQLDWGGWSTTRPGRFTPGKTWYPLYRRLGETQGQSGWVWKLKKKVQGKLQSKTLQNTCM